MAKVKGKNANKLVPAGMKRCSRCHEVKELEAFTKNARRRDGLQHWCRACVAKYDASEAGRAVKRRYEASDAGHEARRRYNATDAGRESKRRYNATRTRPRRSTRAPGSR